MTEGIITKWIVKEGGIVCKGEPLFEMETDKVSITMDAQVSGVLLKIIKDEGETVPITETIAIIGEQGEQATQIKQPVVAEEIIAIEQPPQVQAEPVIVPVKTDRIFSTPRARTTADEKGIDIKNVKPTGHEGLIIEKDVLSHKPKQFKSLSTQSILVDMGDCIDFCGKAQSLTYEDIVSKALQLSTDKYNNFIVKKVEVDELVSANVLSIGKITDMPIVLDGQIVTRPISKFTATYENIDDEEMAQALILLKEWVENPVLIFCK